MDANRVEEIVDLMFYRDGGTWDAVTGQPLVFSEDRRYVVANPMDTYRIGNPERSGEFYEVYRASAVNWVTRIAAWASEGDTIGSWRDSMTGALYLDKGRTYSERDGALAVAEQVGELAIWDGVKGEKIRL